VIRAHSSSFENGMANKARILQKKNRRRRRRQRRKKTFGRLVTFWLDTFANLFGATGHVVSHEKHLKLKGSLI